MNTTTTRERSPRPCKDNRRVVGAVIIAVGMLILLDRLDFFVFPHWLLTWPVLLIAIGFLVGARQNFSGIGWFIMIFVGAFFFAKHHLPFTWAVEPYLWPLIIILVGVLVLFRGTVGRPTPPPRGEPPHNPYRHTAAEDTQLTEAPTAGSSGPAPQEPRAAGDGNGEDTVDLTAIFGAIKRRLFTKNFRFADVTAIFGGVELDLTHADIQHRATIDLTQFFGGTTLIVPANWSVESDLVAILGGINDKRAGSASAARDKILVITGTAICAGIEIKSYA